MKKHQIGLFSLFVFSILMVLSAGQVSAFTITWDNSGGQLVSTASISGGTTLSFEGSLPAGMAISGDYALVTGTGTGHAAPYNPVTSSADPSRYLTVPSSSSSGSATIAFGRDYTYLGLWWGSVDNYNHLYLYNDGKVVNTINGQDVLDSTGGTSGSQTSKYTNLYLNVSGVAFDSIVLTSSNYAFEVDNVTVGNPVPIPAAAWLLGSGLLGLVGIRRRVNR